MKKIFYFLISAISVQTAGAQTCIKNVTVVDVLNHKLIPAQSVTFQGERITNISKSTATTPPKMTVIDGTGKFLMPGMTDAHVHFFQSGGLYTRPDAIDLRASKPYAAEIETVHKDFNKTLLRYLKCGVTSVVDVGATYRFLLERASITDAAISPTIKMTGPLLTTWEPPAFENLGNNEPFSLVKTPEEARAKVREQLPWHPDFIKIWYIVKRDTVSPEAAARKYLPVIQAVVDEAHKNNLRVAVHATERITAQLAVESGCDFLVHSVDDEVIKDDFIKLLRTKKVILCPTLVVHGGYLHTFSQSSAFTAYELSHADPFQLGSLLDLKHITDTALVQKMKTRFRSNTVQSYYSKADSVSMVNLHLLAKAGVTIATGTDAGNIGTLHASSYQAEMKMMEESGMTRWQVLEASTINGAKILGDELQSGSISKGKLATMLLLEANPLESLVNTSRIHMIINKGACIRPDTLLSNTPAELAQLQLNAYNLRNIEAFLAPYAEDVEVYTYPDKLMYKGKETMRKNYSEMFDKNPGLHCELRSRIAKGNVVIDEEHVQFAKGMVEAVAIYHIKDHKIQKVFFIR